MGAVEQYLLQLNTEKRRRRYAVTSLIAMSLAVALLTVWTLRRTGITIANSAGCGQEEHLHMEECMEEENLICNKAEHIHSTDCYPDPKADEESIADWESMFADYPYTGDLRKDLVGIAKTQVGYTESVRNYEMDDEGQHRGYTRYGAWYGAPYNDWSAMFVSFCLNFAGADPEEFPNSSGAETMSELWDRKGNYAPVGQHTPQMGDLVFFVNNTVGIVAEVYNSAFYAICGDRANAVEGEVISLDEGCLKGWGITALIAPEESPSEPPQEESPTELLQEEDPTEPVKEESPGEPPKAEIPQADILDISQGPAFYIFEGKEGGEGRSRRRTRSVTELLSYLQSNGGTYFLTLLDSNNMELPKDEQGNYIAQANTGYKLTISFSSPEGFAPGAYEYQIPNGLMVAGGQGSFILQDGIDVGTWTVSDTGLITLDFNENMNSRSDITISATMGITFPEQEDPIDFDGKITVTVEKPPQQQFPTQMLKWGNQGNAANGQDPTKLYWNVQITGNKDSQIPGNILSDQVLDGEWSKDHRYTQSDIDGGLTFGVSEPDPVTGEFKDWHSWTVSADDPRLIWTETGWSYKMPRTVTCQWCGEVELGNENWIYTVNYTSTPDPVGSAGTYGYENQASVDGQQAYAWTATNNGVNYGREINPYTMRRTVSEKSL